RFKKEYANNLITTNNANIAPNNSEKESTKRNMILIISLTKQKNQILIASLLETTYIQSTNYNALITGLYE
ncbi:45241_t:CDS:1, partial [Gigaspora margarita]